jgi:hypothetical protein
MHAHRIIARLTTLALLACAAAAHALPITLRDSNGTRYNVNSDVSPDAPTSLASGALTDATFQKPVTVTSYFLGYTFFGFTTVYTERRHVNIPLRNAFAGFNGLSITAIDDRALPSPLVFNPGEELATEECPQGGKNRQLVFQTQSFPLANLTLTRKVLVPSDGKFLRWLNVITNTGETPTTPSIALRGVLGSGTDTRVTSTSTGDYGLSSAVAWFTTAQQVPPNAFSTQPKLGFVVQGAGGPVVPQVEIGEAGQTVLTYSPTIQPGESAVVLTFVTVQGSTKQAKKTVKNVVALPAHAVFCMSQDELRDVVNFPAVTAPRTKKATITLNFKKAAADTINWNGSITIGAGLSLQGLPLTIDIGGVTQTFTLNEQGKADEGGGNTFNLQAALKNGVTKAGPVQFSFQLKGDFKDTLAAYGLTDTTVQSLPVTVPASFTGRGPDVYATEQAFTYKATQGKTGTAKSS